MGIQGNSSQQASDSSNCATVTALNGASGGLTAGQSITVTPSPWITTTQPSINSVWTTGTTYYSSDESKESKAYELEELDGSRFILFANKSACKNVIERKYRAFALSKKFPFVRLQTERYVEFDTMKDDGSPWRHKAKISLAGLMDIVGIEFESYEETALKSAAVRG